MLIEDNKFWQVNFCDVRNMAVYIIVYIRNYHRVPNTPEFEYPKQALVFIEKYLGNSKYMTIYRVR